MINSKKTILSTLLIALFTCVIGLCSTSFASVKAQSEIELESYNIVDTTWIRSEAPEGLRFQLEYSTEDKASLSQNAFFGALLIPQTMLEGDLTVDTENVLKIKADVNVVDYNKEGYEAFNVVLLGSNGVELDAALYTTPIVIRGVVVDGDNVGYTQNVVVKSIAQVAQYLILEGDTSEVTAKYTAGLEAQLTAEKTNILAGETLATSFTFANMPVANKTLTVTYASNAPGIADVDAQTGVITGKGNGEAVITATATSIETGNKMTASLTVTSTKETVEVTEFVTFSAKDSTEYTFGGLKGEVISITLNDGTQDLVFESATIAKEELPVGYYDIKGIETTTTSYTFTKQLVVADKVLTTASEFQNWAKYIRPSHWNRGNPYTHSDAGGTYNIYDGLIVLGNDIDFGGQVYKTELATTKLGIGATWYLDKTTGEIYTEEVTGRALLTNDYSGIFVGTFDGLGHTVYDIEVAYFGSSIFGNYLAGTVRNVGFAQAVYSAPQVSGVQGGFIAGNVRAQKDNLGVTHTPEIRNLFVEGGFVYENLYSSNSDRVSMVVGNYSGYPFTAISAIINANPVWTTASYRQTAITYGSATNYATDYTDLPARGALAMGIGVPVSNETLFAPSTYGTAIHATWTRNFRYEDNAWMWDVAGNKFPIFLSARPYFTKPQLSTKDYDGNYSEKVTINATNKLYISNYAQYSSAQALIDLNTFTLAEEYEGVTFDASTMTLTLDNTVAPDTEIVINVVNNITGYEAGSITLVAKEKEFIIETLDVEKLYSIKSTDNVVTDIPVVLDGVDGIVSVELTNNETNESYVFTGSSIVASEITSGYYTVTVKTEVRGYIYQATIADKVIYTAEEFQNWAKYIRPSLWNRGYSGGYVNDGQVYNIYDGLIVLGNDIDFGGQVYKTELATQANGIGGTWYLDRTTGEIYTEAGTGRANLTNNYAGIFVGTFDGLGHTVYNIEIGYYGSPIFGEKLAGTVKNLAVTQVKFTAPQVKDKTSGTIAGGTHTITDNNGVAHAFEVHDIFVEGSFDYDLVYNSNPTQCGLVVGNCNTSGYNYKYYAISAIANTNPKLSAATWGRNTAFTYGHGCDTLGTANNYTIVVLSKNIGKGNAYNPGEYKVIHNNYVKYFRVSGYWNTSKFPIMTSAMDHLTVLDFNETQVSVGANALTIKGLTTNYTMGIMLDLWTVVSNTDGVTFDATTCTLNVADTFAVGTEITLTLTSKINSNLTKTITFGFDLESVLEKPVNGVYYEFDEDGNAHVKGVEANLTNAEIQSTYLGAPVISIKENAFTDASGLANVTIPASITEIGANAFVTNTSLNTVNYLGDENGWAGITFANEYSNPLYFANSLQFNGALVTEINVTLVAEIKEYAFIGCTSLVTVNLGETICTIKAYAFSGCSNLTNLTLSKELASVEEYAFSGCAKLNGINLEKGLANISANAFYGCNQLTETFFVGTDKEWKSSVCVQSGNENFINSIHAYKATSPDYNADFTGFDGKYWYYDAQGKPNAWDEEEFTLYEGNGAGLEYVLNANQQSYSVAGKGTYSQANVIIPAKYNGLPVTKISSFAFHGDTSITTISIPNTVEVIGANAFTGCTSLTFNVKDGCYYLGNSTNKYLCLIKVERPLSTAVNIELGCKIINSFAFEHCTLLEQVILPETVVSVGDYAFSGCLSLKNLTIDGVIGNYGENAFKDCSSLENVYYFASVNDWAVAEYESSYSNPLAYAENLYINGQLLTFASVDANKISNYAFYGYESLTKAKILNLVTSVGKGAFASCINLHYVSVGYNVSVIDDYAFSNCVSLSILSLTQGIENVGDNAFFGCENLISVNYVGTVDSWAEIDFENRFSSPTYYSKNLYVNNELLTRVNLTVASKVSSFAFYNCADIITVTASNSVLSVGEEAFSGCYLLTNVTFGNGVKSIGDSAFEDCSSLVSAVFASAEIIGDCAFYNCNVLASFIVPENAKFIGRYAFYNCALLSEITFENTVAWYATSDYNDYLIQLGGRALDVSNETLNAKNLKTEYYKGYIYRFVELTPGSLYVISITNENELAGSVIGNGTYFFNATATLVATSNPGYTFLGWYDGEELISNESELNFNVSGNKTLITKWAVNVKGLYTVERYFQNSSKTAYDLLKTEEYYGKVGEKAVATITTYYSYKCNQSLSTIDGVVKGDGSLVLKVYYDLVTPVKLTDKVPVSKYQQYSLRLNVEGLGDITYVKLVNNETSATYIYSENVLPLDIPTGYYQTYVTAGGNNYEFETVIADKVIYTAEEFQNWARFVRPSHWNRGVSYTYSDANGRYNLYDGLVVLGQDIDFGGRTYVTELATTKLGIGATWYLHTATGEIYTEAGTGRANLTNDYAGVFIGTFDGLGHTVYDIEIGYFGASIFGNVLAGTVKNVALTQVKYTAEQISGKQGGVLAGNASTITDNNGISHVFEMHDVFVEGGFVYENLYSSTSDRVSMVVGNCNTGEEEYVFRAISAIITAEPLWTVSAGRQTGVTWGSPTCNGAYPSQPTRGAVQMSTSMNACNVDNFTSYDQTVLTQHAVNFKDSGYWNVSGNKFPVFISAMNYLTVPKLSAKSDTNNYTNVVKASTVNQLYLSNYEKYSTAQMLLTLNTLELERAYSGVTFDSSALTLTVDSTVASGTEIVIIYTNVISGNTGTITLVVSNPQIAQQVTINQQVLFDAYSSTEYTFSGLDGEVTEITLNDGTTDYVFTSSTIAKDAIPTGYYNAAVKTETKIYTFTKQVIIADKVIYTAEEFQNWAKYIRPSHWNRGVSYTHSDDGGTYNIYDGLIVLGNDIDFGGQVYKTELATQANGIGGAWYLDRTTGEIYTEAGTCRANLTKDYAGIFVGTFDGLGHTVYNIEIGYYGSPIFGEKLAGTVKNLAVTQVKFTAPQVSDKTSGTIAGSAHTITDNNGVAHAFEVHDIFVEGSFDYDLVYNSNPTQCGLVVGNCNSGGINYKYYAISAIVNTNPKISAASWGRNSSLTYGNGCDVLGTANSYTLVVLSKNFNNVNAYNPGEYIVIHNNYAKNFKVSGYWNVSKFPIMTSAIDHLTELELVAKDTDGAETLTITHGTNQLYVKGLTNYSMGIMLDLWNVTTNVDGVTFDATTCSLSVANTVAVGTEITLNGTSVINGQTVMIKFKVN